MKLYLGNKSLYVQNEDKLVYKTESIEMYDGYDFLHINLELVAGWDYVNPDMNDIQCWCPASRFIEDIQTETVIQYFITESMKEALKAEDYEILDFIPNDLKKIIERKVL